MRPPRALPTAHFDRNDVTIICETVHRAPPGLHGGNPYDDQFVCAAAAR